MSRWADVFAELSSTRDNGDVGDGGDAAGVTVTFVTNVNTTPASAECGESGAEISANITEGLILGGKISNGPDHHLRAALPMTMGTLVTVAAEWVNGIARLDPDRPPADVPLNRWRQFPTDARRLVDDGTVARAVAAGWTGYDLFGCDDTKPFGRVDQMGLVWLVKGSRIISISMSAAVIEAITGARQTYRRKDGAPGRVLVWELFNEGRQVMSDEVIRDE